MIYNNAMKHSTRKYLYSVPYSTSSKQHKRIHTQHIMINANDAGEALQKAKNAIGDGVGGHNVHEGPNKKKVKITWGKPEKLCSNPKYKG